jgi:hypothetical protein
MAGLVRAVHVVVYYTSRDYPGGWRCFEKTPENL